MATYTKSRWWCQCRVWWHQECDVTGNDSVLLRRPQTPCDHTHDVSSVQPRPARPVSQCLAQAGVKAVWPHTSLPSPPPRPVKALRPRIRFIFFLPALTFTFCSVSRVTMLVLKLQSQTMATPVITNITVIWGICCYLNTASEPFNGLHCIVIDPLDLVFTVPAFIVMEAIIVGGYSHDLPGEAASAWLGVSPWRTWEPWSRDQSHMLSDSRPLINSYTKINLLLLAAAASVVCTFLSTGTGNISLHTDTAG